MELRRKLLHNKAVNLWHTDLAYYDGDLSGSYLYKENGKLTVHIKETAVATTYLLGGSTTNDIGFYLPPGKYLFTSASDTFSGIYAMFEDKTTWQNGETKTFASQAHIRAIRCDTFRVGRQNFDAQYTWAVTITRA